MREIALLAVLTIIFHWTVNSNLIVDQIYPIEIADFCWKILDLFTYFFTQIRSMVQNRAHYINKPGVDRSILMLSTRMR